MLDITEPLTLAAGTHQAGSGFGCAMNVISWQNGDKQITDYPSCADPLLSKLVQTVNDKIAELLKKPKAVPYPIHAPAPEPGAPKVQKFDLKEAVLYSAVILGDCAEGVSVKLSRAFHLKNAQGYSSGGYITHHGDLTSAAASVAGEWKLSNPASTPTVIPSPWSNEVLEVAELTVGTAVALPENPTVRQALTAAMRRAERWVNFLGEDLVIRNGEWDNSHIDLNFSQGRIQEFVVKSLDDTLSGESNAQKARRILDGLRGLLTDFRAVNGLDDICELPVPVNEAIRRMQERVSA